MIRFRNPGTQYHTQIQVLKLLYNNLKNKAFFTLDDMARVIANANLMTAYGYAGSNAIKLSHTEQESLNSAKMNAKMYAEVFRMLGWITPYDTTSSYPLVFTYIGIHVAISSGDCLKLYEQCVLGINTPNQFSGNMSYTENIRFFKCVLRTLIDLDGIMYKHELCLGPMCINDNNETEYTNMIAYIKSIRGDVSKLHNAFSAGSAYKNERTEHPTQKPEALITEIIKAFCPKNTKGQYEGLILDPFHGSGTLGVCCEKLNNEGHNIHWIGIEIEEKWCQIAQNRLNAIVNTTH